MNAVAHDILEIQAYLTGQTHAIDNLIKGMLEAFAGDPNTAAWDVPHLPKTRTDFCRPSKS
ncbi:hypothetical protein THIOSC13_1750002 [uncultured Thiomicrorhabdus sp.]